MLMHDLFMVANILLIIFFLGGGEKNDDRCLLYALFTNVVLFHR